MDEKVEKINKLSEMIVIVDENSGGNHMENIEEKLQNLSNR